MPRSESMFRRIESRPEGEIIDRASALMLLGHMHTWGFTPGCYGARRWAFLERFS